MNLGFIGSEQDWQRMRSWWTGATEHVSAVLPDPPPWHAWPGPARTWTNIDESLTDPAVDGVVLAGPPAERPERLRQLVRVGRHCLCVLPADSSAIFYHEIAMLAADGGSVLVPWLPGRLHPAWRKLESIVRSDSFGTVRSVTIERAGELPASQTLVEGLYAEAADLLVAIIGEVTEVTATGDAAAGRLIVHHRTASEVTAEVRLTLLPRAGNPTGAWRIKVESSAGELELSFDSDFVTPGNLTWSDAAGAYELVLPPASPPGIVAEFERATNGQPHCPTWSDATRAAELAEAARLSLERRRAIDVYRESRNELASFKGRMTALGCGLIWVTLLLLFLLAAGKGLNIPGADWLGAVIVLVWLVFLVLQALRWILPREGR